MKNQSLFLVCPDCYLEDSIRRKYGNEVFFLTALGAIFDLSDIGYASEVHQFINDAAITDIYIVHDIECTFIKNVIFKEQGHGTKAEEVLWQLKKANKEKLKGLGELDQQKLLARQSIYNQAGNLSSVTFVGDKIRKKPIHLKGVIYDRTKETFDEFIIGMFHLSLSGNSEA